MNQGNLFDGDKSEKAKEEGIHFAVLGRKKRLEYVRGIARRLAGEYGYCHADMVAGRLKELGYDLSKLLGPAAGAIFRGGWEFTGERITSRRVRNHARELKIWRIADDAK